MDSIGTGSRPGSRATFVSAKVAKTIDAPSGLMGGGEANFLKSGPTRRARTRSANCEESPSLEPAGRRRKIFFRDFQDRGRTAGRTVRGR